MSYIVYQKNKKTGVTYAYESTSYRDKETKQPRSKRKYLGKVDPETGEIVRTYNKTSGPLSPDDEARLKDLQSALEKKELELSKLRAENELLISRLKASQDLIDSLYANISTYLGKE